MIICNVFNLYFTILLKSRLSGRGRVVKVDLLAIFWWIRMHLRNWSRPDLVTQFLLGPTFAKNVSLYATIMPTIGSIVIVTQIVHLIHNTYIDSSKGSFTCHINQPYLFRASSAPHTATFSHCSCSVNITTPFNLFLSYYVKCERSLK